MSRKRRIRAVVGGVGLAAVIWTVAVPVLGHRLIVTGGPSGRESLDIGLAPVVDTATRLTLGARHVAVAAVLIPAMTRTTAQPALLAAGETA
jgi:hypothetical protein